MKSSNIQDVKPYNFKIIDEANGIVAEMIEQKKIETKIISQKEMQILIQDKEMQPKIEQWSYFTIPIICNQIAAKGIEIKYKNEEKWIVLYNEENYCSELVSLNKHFIKIIDEKEGILEHRCLTKDSYTKNIFKVPLISKLDLKFASPPEVTVNKGSWFIKLPFEKEKINMFKIEEIPPLSKYVDSFSQTDIDMEHFDAFQNPQHFLMGQTSDAITQTDISHDMFRDTSLDWYGQ